MTLALKHDWRDETLNLGRLVLRLLAFLDDKGSLDDVLTDVVILGQVEQLPVNKQRKIVKSLRKQVRCIVACTRKNE